MIRGFYIEKEKKSYWFHVHLLFYLIFLFLFFIIIFYLNGEILFNSFVVEKKNVEYTDSYDVTDLSNCCDHLLFRCYYSIGSSVDYHGSALFREFTFNTASLALDPQQNWSDSTCLIFRVLYVMNESYYIKKFLDNSYWW